MFDGERFGDGLGVQDVQCWDVVVTAGLTAARTQGRDAAGGAGSVTSAVRRPTIVGIGDGTGERAER